MREAVEKVLRRCGLTFDLVLAREDAPYKPSPEGLWQICAAWGMTPAEVLMVGDYLYDLQAGRSAGTRTALVTHGRRCRSPTSPTWPSRVSRICRTRWAAGSALSRELPRPQGALPAAALGCYNPRGPATRPPDRDPGTDPFGRSPMRHYSVALLGVLAFAAGATAQQPTPKPPSTGTPEQLAAQLTQWEREMADVKSISADCKRTDVNRVTQRPRRADRRRQVPEGRGEREGR